MRIRAVVLTVIALLSGPAAASAQTPSSEPWAITDNSFFVEEAFNQQRGVFQNIFIWQKTRDGGWDGSFTQEFPAPAMRHQLSYTLPFDGGEIGAHVGSVLVNYRFQLSEESNSHPAISPRASVILPTGRDDGYGNRTGLQFNLPISKQAGNFYLHANAGVTHLFNVTAGVFPAVVGFEPPTKDLTSPTIAGSVIYRAAPMFNVMLESTVEFAEDFDGLSTTRNAGVVISPGFRTGWNFGEKQLVVGAAVPVTRSQGESSVAVLGYFSYELPFSASR